MLAENTDPYEIWVLYTIFPNGITKKCYMNIDELYRKNVSFPKGTIYIKLHELENFYLFFLNVYKINVFDCPIE